MALRFLDSFDHSATAHLTLKWSTIAGVAISAGAGRRGTAGLSAGGTWSAIKFLDNQPTWIVGFAYRPTGYPSTFAPIVELRDSTTVQVDLRLGPTGQYQVTRGGTVLGTSTRTVGLDVFHYLELRATMHASAGAVTFAMDGVTEFALTGLNTQMTANAYANQIRLGPSVFIFGSSYDDVYICDGTGAAPWNTLLGDCRVDMLLPNGDGTHQAWTPSTPGTHYTLVDDPTPNTSDYVSSLTPGQRETFQMQDLPAVPGTVLGAQMGLGIFKSDAGVRSATPLLLSAATAALGTTTILSTSLIYLLTVHPTDPATGLGWTQSAINSVQCGAETA